VHQVLVKFLETESRVAVFSLDGDGRILESNGGMERLFDIPLSRPGGRLLFDFLLPENREQVEGIIRALLVHDPHPEGCLFRKVTLNFRVASSAVHTMACFFSCATGG
jgi:PAS domain-containing protein